MGGEKRNPTGATPERRGGPRSAFDGWVEITSKDGRRRGTAVDLSVDGIGVRGVEGAFVEHGVVRSEFRLPGIGLPLELRGEVRWTRAGGARAGLRFVDPDPGLRELIESFCAGRLVD